MNCPKNAKLAITNSETAAACHAKRTRSRGVLSPTKPRNIGVAPGGSIITKSVTKACVAKVIVPIEFMLVPPFGHLLALLRLPIVPQVSCSLPWH